MPIFGTSGTTMKRVGYWISERKQKKFPFGEHAERFRNAGIGLVEIDLCQPMDSQGPFDLLIHKITDLFSTAHDADASSENSIKNFEEYIQKHPDCVVLDPLGSIRCLMNRYSQYLQVTECEEVKDRRCTVPAFVLLDSNSVSDNRDKLAAAGVTFPLLCKPILAHGPASAHQMSIIFSEDSLKDLVVPCVAQSFINHDAILYKIMVIGCKQFIIKRPSIRNFYPGDYPTIFFDTQLVSKAHSDHPLTALGEQSSTEALAITPDWAYLDSLGKAMRRTMGLDLFGFDVIIDSQTGQYGIIDVNFFPGFEAIDNFFELLFEHVVNVLCANDRGELVNGRLLAPPDVPTTVAILNQLNLQPRRSQEKRDVYKAWPSTPVSPSAVALSSEHSEEILPVTLPRHQANFCREGNNNVICSQADKNTDQFEATRGKHVDNPRSISSQGSPNWDLGQPSYNPDQPRS